ncbi:hypothetical protein K2173_015744 [Erythroxylum novogranatense]|uniref:PROP1-like PPR domain-containing protein n=1 Tax=Erythroxylum novogranatense TaxID=1862640 RepID=A0AAV8TIQ2_9ROSI|nr:hypothetical protein K2173_015744 [Erythroxylum novogranatense]
MMGKHQIHTVLRMFLSSKSAKLNHSPTKFLCTSNELTQIPDPHGSPESPDLPTWLYDKQNPEYAGSDSDDFVIPSLAKWVESHDLSTHEELVSDTPSEENVSDISKLSSVLKNQYPSEDSVVQALNGSGIQPTNDLVSQLLRRFSGSLSVCYGVFIWGKNQTGYRHTPELYNLMVDVLGRHRKFNLMWDFVKEMAGIEGHVSLVTMTKVMRRLAKAGNYDDAIEAFRGMEMFGVTKDIGALNLLMDALVKERSVEHAHLVALEFESSIPLNSDSYNILIHGYCKARLFVEARRTMDEMQKQGFRPCVVSYTSFIEAYSKEKDFRNVDAILEEMRQRGCKPNAITYTIIMHALGKARHLKAAMEVYEIMKTEGCEFDASFYSSLLFILCRCGRVKDAWDVFEDMENQGVSKDCLTYNTMIACACARSQEENALKLLKRMEEDSCKPNVDTYAPLLKLFCRKKRMKMLKLLLGHMFNNDVNIDLGTYALLIRELCICGKLEVACSFFDELILKGMVPWDSTYKILVEKLELKGMAETKQKVEKLMLVAKEQNKL